jgi:hypothetical protein
VGYGLRFSNGLVAYLSGDMDGRAGHHGPPLVATSLACDGMTELGRTSSGSKTDQFIKRIATADKRR